MHRNTWSWCPTQVEWNPVTYPGHPWGSQSPPSHTNSHSYCTWRGWHQAGCTWSFCQIATEPGAAVNHGLHMLAEEGGEAISHTTAHIPDIEVPNKSLQRAHMSIILSEIISDCMYILRHVKKWTTSFGSILKCDRLTGQQQQEGFWMHDRGSIEGIHQPYHLLY